MKTLPLFACTLLALFATPVAAEAPRQVSGIYPRLAYFNNEGECGTGAVVPWAGKLWVITYGPHLPNGSSDKLYEISDALEMTVRPESVGGTPANRMIHRESQQLFIGPYAIDAQAGVRVIPPKQMVGRLTGNARHLTDPAGKIYYATMEEGFYEVDVKTLAVKELFPDANRTKNHGGILLPGYHGKGLYSAQGLLVYANNGELSPEAQRRPDIASGVLAEYNGTDWKVVRRNQFTEVTGPGGIEGNADTKDPLWSVGWDHRSLIVMMLDGGKWHTYRLPKASHTYDGAHGWNTEWPRIRDIGENDLLMTMHGTFWKFPKGFSAKSTAGIAPRSTYLKVVGDFCRWQDRVVLGCDDTAKSEFLNKRKTKGALEGPGQSQSNLWFLEPATLDRLGPALGRGAVWLDEKVLAETPSDAYLFNGYDRRALHLANGGDEAVQFTFEIDEKGTGEWAALDRQVEVLAKGYQWVDLSNAKRAAWIRVRINRDASKVTALFDYAGDDPRTIEAAEKFLALAEPGDKAVIGGLVRARGENKRTLHFAAERGEGDRRESLGLYELDADLVLRRTEDPKGAAWLAEKVAIPAGAITVDAASVLVVDDAGRRWRLPKGDAAFDKPGLLGDERIDREVCTERDLFNAHGTFYELPAENAGGFAKMRPVTTHNRRIKDYCSYRGLLVMTGLLPSSLKSNSPHVIRSDDGRAALWVGAVDDLWQFGKPRGQGGPWHESPVKAGVPSDPYLMTGYDQKALKLSHTGKEPVKMRVEIDPSGTGLWQTYQVIEVAAGLPDEHEFPDRFSAYWIRVTADKDCQATATLTYK